MATGAGAPDPDWARLLDQLPLTRVGDGGDAGLLVTSLPWPRLPVGPVSIDGRPAGQLPVGRWPDRDTPRRLILAADVAGAAPATVRLAAGHPGGVAAPTVGADREVFARSPEPGYLWEQSLLRLRRGDRSVGLAMGLRHRGVVRWWEACRLLVLDETAQCLTVEMAGTIAHQHVTAADHRSQPGYTNGFIHRHNWLNASIWVRLHSNGVCEVIARHVNTRFVDDGLPLTDTVPVLGVRVAGGVTPPDRWDGSAGIVDLGGVPFDLRTVARLATPQRPGEFTVEDGWAVLQPYAGVELFGGAAPEEQTGDPYLFRAAERIFPRGMARTLRFTLSLSDRSPRVVRYLAPGWWYGLCEELTTEPLLPIVAEGDDAGVVAARRWVAEYLVRGGFEDATLPRNDGPRWTVPGGERFEPGWEGEVPYALLLDAWRTGAGYDDALHAAYAITDLAVEHAAKLMRMHGHAPNALSLPMTRLQGTIAGYLETGDPFLLRTARAAIDTAHATHLNSWPRLAVGRDACYLRSAVLLYRYLGDERAREISLEGALTVAASQRDNGSFGDQGGGAGMHAWMGYISKPWMGLLALGGVLDYLELFPDCPPLRRAALRFGDWLMSERLADGDRLGWAYQHDYGGRRVHEDLRTGASHPLPSPPPHWHHETLARLLGYCTAVTGDPSYLAAWRASHDAFWTARPDPISASSVGDHVVAAALQFVPSTRDRAWGARWVDGGVTSRPAPGARLLVADPRVATPRGVVPLAAAQRRPGDQRMPT